MIEVLFVTPNLSGNLEDEPVGTLLLTSILHKHGVSAQILQFNSFGDPTRFSDFCDNAASLILRKKPRIVSFYCRCDVYHMILKIAMQLKEKCSDIYVVLGGPQADICSFDTINELSYIDYVCCGEGESTIYPFFSSLLNNSPDLAVPGLVYRHNGKVHINPRPAFIENLDDLPLVDYSLLKDVKLLEESKYKWFPIDVGRGCPFACTYCSTKSFWGRKYRLKSSQRILQEIKRIHDQFGITSFAFLHDMFTLNRKQVIEVCGLLKELDFNITWKCSARIDCIDEELIDIMFDAGLRIIFVGIESGSQRMQKLINKDLKLDRLYPLLRYIADKGINIISSFIYGFPEETEEDLSKTIGAISSISNLKNIIIQAHLCTFLPGTEMSVVYANEMTPTTEYSDITGTIAIDECMDLIRSHPNLFQHLLEYKTELRTRLKYFRVFVRTYRTVCYAYQYLSEKYSPDRLIDMYYDFVDSNQELLLQIEELPVYAQVKEILKQDKFIHRFDDDEYIDIVSDYCRLILAQISDQVRDGGVITDIYSFSPIDIKNEKKLQDFTRGIFLVSCYKNEDGSIGMKVRS